MDRLMLEQFMISMPLECQVLLKESGVQSCKALEDVLRNKQKPKNWSGDFWGSQEGCQGPSRPSGRNRGLPLRRRRGQGPHVHVVLPSPVPLGLQARPQLHGNNP